MSPGAIIAGGCWGLIALGIGYGISCDVRRWWAERRQSHRLKRLRKVYEKHQATAEAVERRAVEGVCRYLSDLADQLIEIRNLPETDEPRIAL